MDKIHRRDPVLILEGGVLYAHLHQPCADCCVAFDSSQHCYLEKNGELVANPLPVPPTQHNIIIADWEMRFNEMWAGSPASTIYFKWLS